ncbi:uncharacterized protein LOC124372868, partial [Homalodisca vitripennis]|uniref:uncharacterized protein LOC124372868 n=1 Tax=Homalodisca vitripennis TaxID=197043 RepID=UPI001EEB9116
MKRAVWAEYFHLISTNKEPAHSLCPKTADTWCKYQQAIQKKEAYAHNEHFHIAPVVMEQVKQIFKDLANSTLLAKCLRGQTQNPSESLNSVVLSRKQLEINEDDKQFGQENGIADEPKDAQTYENIKPNKKEKTASAIDSKTKGKQGSPAKSKEAGGKMKSDKKKSVSPPKESILPLSENSVDLRYSVFDEKIAYDTSKLTIAEYFEMMDLEDGEPRDEYLKEKLDEFKVIIPPLNQHRKKYSRPKSIKELKIGDFEFIGTLQNEEFSDDFVQEGVTEIINASRENLSFIKDVAKCGVIIYNILDDSEQAVEASWVLNSLSYFMQELKEDGEISKFTPPLFILLSTFMSWSLSKSLDP